MDPSILVSSWESKLNSQARKRLCPLSGRRMDKGSGGLSPLAVNRKVVSCCAIEEVAEKSARRVHSHSRRFSLWVLSEELMLALNVRDVMLGDSRTWAMAVH